MPKKSTKSKRPQKYGVCKSAVCHPSFWLIIILSITLLAVCGISAYGFKQFTPKNNIDAAKLAVFDDIAKTYIRENDITDNGVSEVYQMTGYGISDEDGVFYITFDFADPATTTVTFMEDGTMALESARHGIMYFWPSEASDTGYGHAYSYHDDDYRPAGTYVEFGKHSLRN